MSVAEFGFHEVGIVEVGKGCAGEFGARFEDCIRNRTDFGSLGIGGIGPGKGVVDNPDRVAVIALEPAADEAQPGHVHAGSENAEMPKVGIEEHADKITGNDWWLQPADGNIFATLGAYFGYDEEWTV